ncbi:hypothetical protein J437_LFUL002596 [Ladona fulva]|uniref:Band 7 domain-containing protein n=1 Tax=Ladona fulva TaxID=123851 RepID=A0A8K0NUP8_LADFU|nr:hypothetical protein J437_LFUL002596 [Ladona fulva]
MVWPPIAEKSDSPETKEKRHVLVSLLGVVLVFEDNVMVPLVVIHHFLRNVYANISLSPPLMISHGFLPGKMFHFPLSNIYGFFFLLSLGTLTVEEVYKDRDQFAALVREVAAPDVGRMGIEILSFTIKDVYDDVQYLASLGKAQTANVKRDADIGVAQANRDAGIREAECEKSAMDIKYNTDTKIEDNARMYKLQKANFDKETNTAKAEAQLAYELQAAKIRQKIRNEEIQIEVVERRKMIEVEAQEVQRKERELNSTVRLPAEAESYRVQTIAEGKRTQTVEVAKADGEKIKMLGAAEAYAIESVGKSEAERMRMKAEVYKHYGEAAIMALVLEALPKIAAEVSAPLAKTEEIVLLGGDDHLTSEVNRLVGQIPPAVQALTGVDLSKVTKIL